MQSNKYKVVLLGAGRVGKSSIVYRYVKGEYTERQVSTVQASYLNKTLTLSDIKKQVELALWDTAGQERYHALGPIYYRDANGAVLVYDITDADSFSKVKNWVKELKRIVGKNQIEIVIAGNKVDLHRNRQVEEEDAIKYAESVGATHYQTSAKLNKGLENVFTDLAKRMMAKSEKHKSNSLIVDDEEPSYNKLRQTSSSSKVGSTNSQRSRNGGRGQAIQIVDDVPDVASSVRDSVASHHGKTKNGCC